MNEIDDATARISTLVGAAKQYSQIDRAPYQTVDVHELLDSTLTMLERQDRRRDHGGQGLRPHAAADPRVTPPSSTRCGPTSSTTRRRRWTAHGHADPDAPGASTTGCEVEIADTGPGIPDERRRPDLRAVLHHQARRLGHRPRARHLVADRRQQAPRRPRPSPPSPGDTRFLVRLPLLPDGRTHPVTADRHRPDRARRAAPAASSATPPTAGGSTCAAAPPAATSAAATPRRRSTRPRTSARPGTRVIRTFEPGEDWFWDYAADDYTQGPALAAPEHRPARADRARARPAASPTTGAAACTDALDGLTGRPRRPCAAS